jgi:hypothetical protein
MKKITINSFEELSSDKARRRVLGRRRFHTRVVTGVPVHESVEYRILQLKKEIAAMDAANPKSTVMKEVISITTVFGTTLYNIDILDVVISSNIKYSIIEVEVNTPVEERLY